MAYRKITRTPNLPAASEPQPSSAGTEADLGWLKRFCSSLVAALTPFLSDLVGVVNDLAGGYIYIVILQKQTAAPPNPVSGMVVYADGTIWNPGSGEGYYGYYGAAWHLLG